MFPLDHPMTVAPPLSYSYKTDEYELGRMKLGQLMILLNFFRDLKADRTRGVISNYLGIIPTTRLVSDNGFSSVGRNIRLFIVRKGRLPVDPLRQDFLDSNVSSLRSLTVPIRPSAGK